MIITLGLMPIDVILESYYQSFYYKMSHNVCFSYLFLQMDEDEERRKRRREKNKVAAARCRNKKKERTDFLQRVSSWHSSEY